MVRIEQIFTFKGWLLHQNGQKCRVLQNSSLKIQERAITFRKKGVLFISSAVFIENRPDFETECGRLGRSFLKITEDLKVIFLKIPSAIDGCVPYARRSSIVSFIYSNLGLTILHSIRWIFRKSIGK